MDMLQYRTRQDVRPNNKPHIYYCAHPEDYAIYRETICKDLLYAHDCAFWYATPDQLLTEKFLDALKHMQLFVVPITKKLLTTENYALTKELQYAERHNIAILPLLQEPGLIGLFTDRFGTLQYLDVKLTDKTKQSYPQKLAIHLDVILGSDALVKRVRAAFSDRIFLSYRKKDRELAMQLMQRIHACDICRDTAIWYDEFLISTEHYDQSIQNALAQSTLVVLNVTPILLEKSEDPTSTLPTNYVVDMEYPKAKEMGKPILPVEMVHTDPFQLYSKLHDLPVCVNGADIQALSAALAKALNRTTLPPNANDPEHCYLIGVAYLKGIDVEVNHSRAAQLIQYAAEHGVIEAAETLVDMYAQGQGFNRSAEGVVTAQAKLIELRRQAYASNPSAKNGLALLTDLQTQAEFLSQLGLDEASQQYYQLMKCVAQEVVRRTPSPEANRYLFVALLGEGNQFRYEGRYDKAVLPYKEGYELLRSTLQSLHVKLFSDRFYTSQPCQGLLLILLRDYCTAMCNYADILVRMAELTEEDQYPELAIDYYRTIVAYLESPEMKNNFSGYKAQLSTAYSRLAETVSGKEKQKLLENALELDAECVLNAGNSRDSEAYDNFAKGLFAIATQDPERPDAIDLLMATDIWRLLAELMPEFPDLKEKYEELKPYAEAVAQWHDGECNRQHPGSPINTLRDYATQSMHSDKPYRRMSFAIRDQLYRLSLIHKPT